MEIKHFSHPHPLVLLDEQQVGAKKEVCNGCLESIEGCSSYSCGGCKYFLHRKCAELPREIHHPLHLSHPLILDESPWWCSCDVCGCKTGFMYSCRSCGIVLDIKCATHPQFAAGELQKLQHFSHRHPLIFVEHVQQRGKYCRECEFKISGPFYWCPDCRFFYLHKACAIPPHEDPGNHEHPLVLTEEMGNNTGDCFRCLEPIQAPMYKCGECEFSLHKKCAELPFKISNHHFHLQHPLFLFRRSYGVSCRLCKKSSRLTYRCFSCDFKLDIGCATNPKLTTGSPQTIQHFSHSHALVLAEDVDIQSLSKRCPGCEEFISSSFYCCLDCGFYIHKICAELPSKINHPTHRKHPLSFVAKPHSHCQGCQCYLCKKSYKGYVYSCSTCDFSIKGRDAFLQTVKAETHEHPFTPLFKTMPFICDACGTNHGDQYFPYACTECGLTVHKDCIALPKVIKITRHQHRLSHTYLVQEEEDRKRNCSICLDEVHMVWGMYCCLDCNFFVHVNCAMDTFYLEDTNKVEDGNQESEHSLPATHGDRREHFSHKHSLLFSASTVEDGQICDGCMRSISTSFYKCEECNDFFLHQSCFDLSTKVRHWICKHSRNLEFYALFYCDYCNFNCSGFGYYCGGCGTFMCIHCHEVPPTCTIKRHDEQHRLIFDHKYEKECNGCGAKPDKAMFKCKECNSYALDYRCLALPDTAAYKHDEHPLVLCASSDNSDPSQYYCDICEKGRNQGHWFYKCGDCDVSAHVDCVLGVGPFVKLGKPFRHWSHEEHLVNFVKIDFNPPKCNRCNKPCRDLAVRCTEVSCNYIAHWRCLPDWYITSRAYEV